MIVAQLALVAAIRRDGQVDPVADPRAARGVRGVGGLSVGVAGRRARRLQHRHLEADERAAGASIYFIGYRLAMWSPVPVALVMADHVVWRVIYTTMAAMC